MKLLYLDCNMGAAGDMLTAALLELLPDPEGFVRELNALEIPGVVYRAEKSVKCGITGTHMTVTVDDVEEESTDAAAEGHECHGHEYHSHEYHSHEDHGHECHSHEGHGHEGHSHECHSHEEHAHEGHSHEGHSHENHSCEGHSHEGHTHEHGHHHSSFHEIEHLVREHLVLPKKVQDDIMAVYRLIAEAESHVHGRPVAEIHFHEVGTMDAVADVTAVCLLMDRLEIDRVVVSPVHVGSGQVRCAHGILPVPAPATAYLLRDVPIYGGQIRGELCTPTGAALLKHFAAQFGEMPVMRIQAIGYGMGKKDFEAANCVRAMLGRMEDEAEEIVELNCNVDDMTGEEIGFAMERLFEAGAMDVFTEAIGMKKSRPGVLLKVLCAKQQKEKMVQEIFRHTTTIGIRECGMHRYVLEREIVTVQTPYGPVRCKISNGYGTTRRKFEYEDFSRIAAQEHMELSEVRKLAEQAAQDEDWDRTKCLSL